MVEIYVHFLADQKNCISIDLRGAQVNKIDSIMNLTMYTNYIT